MTEHKHDDAGGASRLDAELAAEVERLVNELAHLHCINGILRADAERYQWLRSRVWANDPNVFSLPVLVSTDGANIMRGSVAQHFDDAIDHKRKAANACGEPGLTEPGKD